MAYGIPERSEETASRLSFQEQPGKPHTDWTTKGETAFCSGDLSPAKPGSWGASYWLWDQTTTVRITKLAWKGQQETAPEKPGTITSALAKRKSKTTKTCPSAYLIFQLSCFWLVEQIKTKTLAANRSGRCGFLLSSLCSTRRHFARRLEWTLRASPPRTQVWW